MNFSRGVGGSLSYSWKFRRGGGHQFLAKMENPGRWGGPKWNSLRGGGLDIFWNYTFLNIISWNSSPKGMLGWYKPKCEFLGLTWDPRYFPALALKNSNLMNGRNLFCYNPQFTVYLNFFVGPTKISNLKRVWEDSHSILEAYHIHRVTPSSSL